MKTIKKVVKKAKVEKPQEVVKEKCPVCRGSGLWRPDFTNSPQCEKCQGHGFIN